MVDVHIAALRKKLGDDPENPASLKRCGAWVTASRTRMRLFLKLFLSHLLVALLALLLLLLLAEAFAPAFYRGHVERMLHALSMMGAA